VANTPKWTVVTNIVSPEGGRWVGTSWEFFDDEGSAALCFERHAMSGNFPTKRPFFSKPDFEQINVAQRVAMALMDNPSGE
jgi:hypothetical protein